MTDFDPQRYWEARLSEDLSLSGVGNVWFGLPYNRWLYRIRRIVWARVLTRLDLPSDTSALDLGSGTGFMIDVLQENGVSRIMGLDITDSAVAHLTEKYPTSEFRRRDIGDPELTASLPERFDLVTANDVLFHIVDDSRLKEAVESVFQLVRPGGYFLFTDFFLHRPTERAEHEVDRSLVDMESMLRRIGFRPIARTPVFVLSNTPVDSENRFLRGYWGALRHLLHRLPRANGLLGALLYLPERAALAICGEGPSTELMVCQRPLHSESRP